MNKAILKSLFSLLILCFALAGCGLGEAKGNADQYAGGVKGFLKESRKGLQHEQAGKKEAKPLKEPSQEEKGLLARPDHEAEETIEINLDPQLGRVIASSNKWESTPINAHVALILSGIRNGKFAAILEGVDSPIDKSEEWQPDGLNESKASQTILSESDDSDMGEKDTSADEQQNVLRHTEAKEPFFPAL